MSNARRAVPSLTFNGKNVTTKLAGYLESVKYEDVASGSSDALQIALQNIEMKWMSSWYPKKGDKVKGKLTFKDWNKDGVNLTLNCGTFVLDEVKQSGGPLRTSFECLSIPASESFKTRERTKTWKKITIQSIASEIAKRYKLKLSYSGPAIKINSLEQSKKADSTFLYDLCKNYGLSMKVYNSKIIIYDQTAQEKKKATVTVNRKDFVDDEWDFIDSLDGTYTGARISYKKPKPKKGDKEKEISIYVGFIAEKAKGSRVLKITETADSKEDAYYKATAKLNLANQEATTITGTIWANPKVCAGICINIKGLGKADGKYFVDKSTIELSGSGTKQRIEIHKVQKRLSNKQKAKTPKKKTTPKKKNFKVGDIVTFNGGTHYVSSYPGARGYSAKAGKAKITLGPNCAGNGKAHPWHLIHTDSKSNVYGWVDEGSFS